MKKILLTCLVISMVLMAVLPVVAYAKPGDDLSTNGIEILKKNPPKDLKNLGQQIKNLIASYQGNKHFPPRNPGVVGPSPKGERYAIIIGINDYPGPDSVLAGGLDLFYAVNDAQAVSNMLVGVEGYKPQNIIMLTDRDATKSGILNQISALKKKVKSNDEVVFYFSGHSAKYSGKAVPAFSRFGDKVGMLVWANDLNESNPVVLWDRELKAAFDGFRTDRIVFGFDCCYAGGFNELAAPGRIVLMAADGQDGISAEYGPAYGPEIPELGPCQDGLFTYFFVVMGLTYGMADSNGDGIVTVEESFNFTQPILTGFTQQAQAMGQTMDEIPIMIDLFWGELKL